MRINRREMALLFFGGFFVVLLLYYLIIISPALSKQQTYIDRIQRKQSDLKQMIELKGAWDAFISSKTRAEKELAARGKTFSLLSYLEGTSREVGINDNIQYMKPMAFQEESGPLKHTGIEMSLDDIDVAQLVKLLYKIECSGKLLNVKRIRIQRTSAKTSRGLKVTLLVTTYTFG